MRVYGLLSIEKWVVVLHHSDRGIRPREVLEKLIDGLRLLIFPLTKDGI